MNRLFNDNAALFPFQAGDKIRYYEPVWDMRTFVGRRLAQGYIDRVTKEMVYVKPTLNAKSKGYHKKYMKDVSLAGTENTEKYFVQALQADFKNLTKKKVEQIAKNCDISDLTKIKELYETALLLYVRSLKLPTSRASFDKIVEIYKNQISLTLRTSNSVMLQQYSTPIPLAWLAGCYVRHTQTYSAEYFEPSAGNGLLTIALPENETTVNEIDKTRRANLENFHKYANIKNVDGSEEFKFPTYFDGIITNPPFGSLPAQTFGGYKISKLEHVMTIHALNTMHNKGRAAIIIGGHTEWDKYNRVENGANRYFLSYLHHFYNVEDVINIKGEMYAKQGTKFPIRLILINGRKSAPEGTAPLKTDRDRTVMNWAELWDRVAPLIDQAAPQYTDAELEKMALQMIAEMESEGLGGFDLSGIKTGKRKTGNYQEIKSLEDLFLCTIYRYPAYYSFGTIDKKAAETVKNQTKKDVKGYELHLDTDHLRHFYDRHYNETDGKHLGVKFSDFQKLIHIIDGFTKVETGKTSDSLVFTKKFTNGIYELVVIIDSKHNFLYGKSFRINT